MSDHFGALCIKGLSVIQKFQILNSTQLCGMKTNLIADYFLLDIAILITEQKRVFKVHPDITLNSIKSLLKYN